MAEISPTREVPADPTSRARVLAARRGARRARQVEIAFRVGLAILAVQLIVLLIVSSHEYHHFDLGADFANFHHAWYQIAHGDLNPQQGHGAGPAYPFWRDEFNLIIWVLAPLYYLYPHSIDLLWIQDAASVGAEAVALWWLVEVVRRRPLRDPWAAVTVIALAIVIFVSNPWVYLGDVQDFHLESLGALFLILAAREVWKGRRGRTWIWIGATLLTGSVGAISLAGLGLSTALMRRSRARWEGLAILATAVGWVGLIVALGANGGGGVGGYGALVGHPGHAVHLLADNGHQIYQDLAPAGFVGALWPWGAGVVVVLLLVNALGGNQVLIAPGFQNFAVYVFAALGTAMVVASLFRKRPGSWLVGLVAGAFMSSAIVFSLHRIPHLYQFTVDSAAANQLDLVSTRIPSDAEVVSSYGIGGRFSGRRFIYLLGAPHQTIPIRANKVIFVFAPAEGNQPLPLPNAMASVAVVRDWLHAALLSDHAGVYAYSWNPPAGMSTLVLA
jgi:hypothetical protein